MEFANRYDGINDYASRLIKYKAKSLAGNHGYIGADVQDLEQELMIDLLRRLPKYDPKLGRLTTFIIHVVNKKTATLIARQYAGKRDIRFCAFSLNEELEDQDGNATERMDTFNQDYYLKRTGRQTRSKAEQLELSMDIRRAAENLPTPRLRDICHRFFQGQRVVEMAQEMGIPRSTLYEAIYRIRREFERSGLREYLEK